MKYNIKIKQADLIEGKELELYHGLVDNINEFSYFEKGSDVKTSVILQDDYLEIIRYGEARTIIHITNQKSYLKVISQNGNFEMPINKIDSKFIETNYVCEYQIIVNQIVAQHFKFQIYIEIKEK